MSRSLFKYLSKHAEPETECAGLFETNEPFGHVVVIPVYGEEDFFFKTLASLPEGPLGEILVIIVLNAAEDSPEWAHEKNAEVKRKIFRIFNPQTPLLSNTAILSHPRGRLLLIDRSENPHLLPKKQGVGLARKIGCDVALALWAKEKIRSRWIHTTDADVILPCDYFEQAEKVADKNISALLYAFERVPNMGAEQISRNYDAYLRYYAKGLAWAGSPYGYVSLGSAMGMDMLSYSEASGFPKLKAGKIFIF